MEDSVVHEVHQEDDVVLHGNVEVTNLKSVGNIEEVNSKKSLPLGPKGVDEGIFLFKASGGPRLSQVEVTPIKKGGLLNSVIGPDKFSKVVGPSGNRFNTERVKLGLPDLNVRADDPFDIDRIIWGGDFKKSRKKRKRVNPISNTFLPEDGNFKKGRVDLIVEDDKKVGGGSGNFDGSVKLVIPENTQDVGIEVSGTVEVGAILSVDLKEFEQDVEAAVKGEKENFCNK
ncbi:hypothetical protein Hanom_Chr12g01143521 [Helianthus anomalus]